MVLRSTLLFMDLQKFYSSYATMVSSGIIDSDLILITSFCCNHNIIFKLLDDSICYILLPCFVEKLNLLLKDIAGKDKRSRSCIAGQHLVN